MNIVINVGEVGSHNVTKNMHGLHESHGLPNVNVSSKRFLDDVRLFDIPASCSATTSTRKIVSLSKKVTKRISILKMNDTNAEGSTPVNVCEDSLIPKKRLALEEGDRIIGGKKTIFVYFDDDMVIETHEAKVDNEHSY